MPTDPEAMGTLPELTLQQACDMLALVEDNLSALPVSAGDSLQLNVELTIATAFLERLGGPSLVHLNATGAGVGTTIGGRRLLVTLLHGNEPSGLLALLRFLRNGLEAEGPLACIVANPAAARENKPFSSRYQAGHRDINRCFFDWEPDGSSPAELADSRLANRILASIESYAPSCVIDIHNTSGKGPAFAVSISDDTRLKALAALWTGDMIVTDLRLGALMELSERSTSTVTIECGGAADPNAVTIAYEGLRRFSQSSGATMAAMSSGDERLIKDAAQTQVFHNPMRLELSDTISLSYCAPADFHDNVDIDPVSEADLILPDDADALNFGAVCAGTRIARLQGRAASGLSIMSVLGSEEVEGYFEVREGGLFTRFGTRFFMMTTRADIARSDCLCYFVTAP